MRSIYPPVFTKTKVVNELGSLHDKSVLVPAYNASNNNNFVCKDYNYECLLKVEGFTYTSWNPTYT
jgi:hypothetical protein